MSLHMLDPSKTVVANEGGVRLSSRLRYPLVANEVPHVIRFPLLLRQFWHGFHRVRVGANL